MNSYFNSDFFNLNSLTEKINFFSEGLLHLVENVDGNDLNKFLTGVILNVEENNYVRKRALNAYVECVFIDKIKIRHALNLLLDELSCEQDFFVQMQRLKDLYYFYEAEKDEVINIYNCYKDNIEAELSSEAYFNLGLINLHESFIINDSSKRIILLTDSYNYFTQSCTIIENRIDSFIYADIVKILIGLLEDIGKSNIMDILDVSNAIFKKEMFSFSVSTNPFYISLYKNLYSLINIYSEKPSNWIDFKQGLDKIYINYCEVKNQFIKNRLSLSSLSNLIINSFEKDFFNPYFTLNFNYHIVKLDILISDSIPDSDEYHFLNYIRDKAKDDVEKKKIEFDQVKDYLKRLLPYRDMNLIESHLYKLSNLDNYKDILNLYLELKAPSEDEFIDKLVSACLSLQSNRIYLGRSVLEDDRNTYIADLLEASGFNIKDQTKRSISFKGKASGEIDIFIQDAKKMPYAIIEALNLTYLDSNYIRIHIDKIFTYDSAGNPFNVILNYCCLKDLPSFWIKYTDFITKHDYKHPFVSLTEISNYPYSDIKICKVCHNRNGMNVSIYHIVLDVDFEN